MPQAPIPEERPEGEVAESDAALVTPRHDPYAAWRVRSYALFTVGGLFAGIGSQMQTVAVGWEIYERTGEAMSLGWVGLAQGVPILLFAMWSGHLADKFDRRLLVLLGVFLQIACSIGLALLSTSAGSNSLIYLILFCSGMARAIYWPASASLLPLLVSKDVFGNAVTWRSTTFQIASVVGPALGGALIAIRHSAVPVYVVNAALTLLYFLAVVLMRVRGQKRASETASVDSLLAGFRYLWQNQIVFAAITLDLFAVLLGGATALLPIYAKDILHVGPTGLGCLQAAPAFGAVVMAVTIAHLPPMRRAGSALLAAVAGFGVVTVVFGLSQWFWLSLLMLAFSGALDNISVVIRHSLIQLRTPDALRGRVSAVNSIFISSSNELGGFRAGAVAAVSNAVTSVVLGGVGTILVVLATAKLWPQIWKLGKLHEEESPRK